MLRVCHKVACLSLDANNTFTDATDLLVDITGVTDSIATSSCV
jgi:hypothetical protein